MAKLQTIFTSRDVQHLTRFAPAVTWTLDPVGVVGWSFLSVGNLSAPKALDVLRHCCKQWFPFKVETTDYTKVVLLESGRIFNLKIYFCARVNGHT